MAHYCSSKAESEANLESRNLGLIICRAESGSEEVNALCAMKGYYGQIETWVPCSLQTIPV